jgi:hypothetical protein
VIPYSTCDDEAISVVQVMVADVLFRPVANTAVMMGGTAAGVVANVKLAEVDVTPDPLVDRAA